jgi:hypothetical protein
MLEERADMPPCPETRAMTNRDAPGRAPPPTPAADAVEPPGESTSASCEPPDFIAENLRRLYGAVESEALPDRFVELLRRLADEEDER